MLDTIWYPHRSVRLDLWHGVVLWQWLGFWWQKTSEIFWYKPSAWTSLTHTPKRCRALLNTIATHSCTFPGYIAHWWEFWCITSCPNNSSRGISLRGGDSDLWEEFGLPSCVTCDKMAYTVYFSKLLRAQMAWRTEWLCSFQQAHSQSLGAGGAQLVEFFGRTCFGDLWFVLALDKIPPLGLNFSSRDAVSNKKQSGDQSKAYGCYGRGVSDSDFPS